MTTIPSNLPATRTLSDYERQAVIQAIDLNDDRVLQKTELPITSTSLSRKLDTNRNNRIDSDEAKQGLKDDSFAVVLSRMEAIQVLYKLDANQDGFLAPEELQMNQPMINLLDGYGSS